MRTFSQSKVWHSFLKAKSPLVIRLKSEPIQSKYDESKIVYFNVRNDEGDSYYYQIESPDILEQIEDLDKSLWYKVTAGGGQDGQFLKFEAAGAAPAGGGGGGGSYSTERTFSTGNVVDDWLACLEQAKQIAKDELDVAVKASIESANIVKELATTLYISWKDTRFLKPLSADDVEDVVEYEIVEDQEDGRSDDYAVELGELLDTIPKDSGKAHDGRALKTTLGKFREALDTPISDELYSRMKKWLDDEFEFQSPAEIAPDDLPF